jgi:hypothetical protein
MEKWYLKRIYSGGSRVRHENKAFELLHINLSVNEKLFIWFLSQTLRSQWAVWSGSMLWAVGRNRGHFEWQGGRITLVKLHWPRGWGVNKHRRDTESLFRKKWKAEPLSLLLEKENA